MDIKFYIGLTIVAIAVYLMVMSIPKRAKRNLLSQTISKEKSTSFFSRLKNRRKFFRYFSPYETKKSAEMYGWEMSSWRYWTSFTISAAGAVIVIGVYFSNVILMLLAIVGGVILPNFEVHRHKKKYRGLIQTSIGIYMQSVASTISTLNNTSEAIRESIAHLDDPVKSSLENCLARLHDGTPIKQAFKPFVDQFAFNEVKLFHDVLQIVDETGSDQEGQLKKIAAKFKRKRYYQRKITTSVNSYKRTFKAMALMILTMPLTFMIVTFDNYKIFVESIYGNLALVVSALIILLVYIQIEKLSVYDPTEDKENVLL